jgi:hypothetical protein
MSSSSAESTAPRSASTELLHLSPVRARGLDVIRVRDGRVSMSF